MKIDVCDVCAREGKLTKRKGRYRLKGHRSLSLDYCANHLKLVPKKSIPYVQFVWKIKFGLDITEEQAKGSLKRSI